MSELQTLTREAFLVAAILAFPVLTCVTLVGVTIAVIQAVTQVQEQTLTMLPKLIAVATLVATFGAFGLHLCGELFTSAIAHVRDLVSG